MNIWIHDSSSDLLGWRFYPKWLTSEVQSTSTKQVTYPSQSGSLFKAECHEKTFFSFLSKCEIRKRFFFYFWVHKNMCSFEPEAGSHWKPVQRFEHLLHFGPSGEVWLHMVVALSIGHRRCQDECLHIELGSILKRGRVRYFWCCVGQISMPERWKCGQ